MIWVILFFCSLAVIALVLLVLILDDGPERMSEDEAIENSRPVGSVTRIHPDRNGDEHAA